MVSVIVPVYNAEVFLGDTISSVFRQTYADWELILVDDGSTDRSGPICERAARRSSKVKVIHKRNGGLSSARNAALSTARGRYIFFLDADDILAPSALEILTGAAISHQCDITCGRISEFFNLEKLLISHKYLLTAFDSVKYTLREHTPEEALNEILYQKSMDNSVCGKLFASHLWKNNRFREATGYEDLDIIYKIVPEANKVGCVRLPLYFYRQHPGSYIHTFNLGRSDVLEVTQRMVDYMQSHYPSMAEAARSRQLSANFNILVLIASNMSSSKKDNNITADKADAIALQCWKKIKELRGESLRNSNVRLKNKVAIVLSYAGGRKLLEFIAKKTPSAKGLYRRLLKR